jgi:hypothetical protein
VQKYLFLLAISCGYNDQNKWEITEEREDILISNCGNCVLDKNEECDSCLYEEFTSHCEFIAISNQCELTYNPLPQMDCNNNWIGPKGCDEEEADLYCKILTKNKNAVAKDNVQGHYISTQGFWSPVQINGKGIELTSVPNDIYPTVFYYEDNPFNTIDIHTMIVPNCFINE